MNQDIKNTFTILVPSSSIFFIQLHVVCLTFEILFTEILHFFNTWGTLLSQHYSLFFTEVSSHSVFVVQRRNGLFVISWERAWTCSFYRFSGIIICGLNRSEKDRHLCRWDEAIRRDLSQNAAFFRKSEHTINKLALSSPVLTVYARNAWVF